MAGGQLVVPIFLAILLLSPGVGAQSAIDQDHLLASYQNYGLEDLFTFAPPLQIIKWDAVARLQAPSVPATTLADLDGLYNHLESFLDAWWSHQSLSKTSLEEAFSTARALDAFSANATTETRNYGLLKAALDQEFLAIARAASEAANRVEVSTAERLGLYRLAADAANAAQDSVDETRLRAKLAELESDFARDMAKAGGYEAFAAEVLARSYARVGPDPLLYDDQTLAQTRLAKAIGILAWHGELDRESAAVETQRLLDAVTAENRNALYGAFALLCLMVVALTGILSHLLAAWSQDRHNARLGEELIGGR